VKERFPQIVEFDRTQPLIHSLIDQRTIKGKLHELELMEKFLPHKNRAGAHGALQVAGIGGLDIQMKGKFAEDLPLGILLPLLPVVPISRWFLPFPFSHFLGRPDFSVRCVRIYGFHFRTFFSEPFRH
jgi:hypothetical protein